MLIAEIQQNSNITYRVYDYGRLGADGKPRQLHIEEAVRVIKREPVFRGKSSMPHIAQCDYFTVDMLHLDGGMMRCVSGEATDDSFISILVLDGEDCVGRGLTGRFMRYIGEAVVNTVNIFRPDRIVLGGIVAEQGEALLQDIRQYIADDCFGGAQAELPDLALAALGSDAGLTGAANLI